MRKLPRAKAVFLTINSSAAQGVVISLPELDSRGSVTGYVEFMMGEVKTQEHRHEWLEEAFGMSQEEGFPLIVIHENRDEIWGKWLSAIEDYPERQRRGKCKGWKPSKLPPHHIVQVNPVHWRTGLFGKTRKPSTVRYVHRTLDQPLNLSDNIAEALCLRVWGERAAVVHALLKRKAKKKGT